MPVGIALKVKPRISIPSGQVILYASKFWFLHGIKKGGSPSKITIAKSQINIQIDAPAPIQRRIP